MAALAFALTFPPKSLGHFDRAAPTPVRAHALTARWFRDPMTGALACLWVTDPDPDPEPPRPIQHLRLVQG